MDVTNVHTIKGYPRIFDPKTQLISDSTSGFRHFITDSVENRGEESLYFGIEFLTLVIDVKNKPT
jgi:hypothetical protein